MRLKQEQKGSLFLLMILVIIIAVSAFFYFSLKEDPVADILSQEQIVKILMVMEGQDEVLNTSVLFYYPSSHRGAVINIPENVGSIYNSIGRVDRIDQIYIEKGISTYKTEIERLIGTNIPFNLVITLEDFQKLTDMLGGIKVLVPSPIDAISPTGEHWLLPSGAVSLDGDKIATYLEYSIDDETDSSVNERRQNIVVAFLSALNRNYSTIFTKQNFKFYSKYFSANIDNAGLYELLQEVANIDSERIVPQSVTGTRRIVDGKELIFPYYDGQLIKDVVMQTVNSLVSESGTLSSRVYVLEIKNGTTTQGLAHNTSALLRSAGYDVLRTLNADSNNIEKTEIIDHIGNPEAVKSLGNFIRCTNITEEEIDLNVEYVDSSQNVDFTLILGSDFDGRYVH